MDDVVRPGRIGKPYRRLRRGIAGELQRLPDRAGAARRCDGGDTLVGHCAAEHQPPHRGREGRVAGKPGVGLGRLGLPHHALGFLDGAHDGGPAIRVAVDAHAEVDLVVPRILAEHRHQLQDLVGRLLLEVGQHGGSGIGRVRVRRRSSRRTGTNPGPLIEAQCARMVQRAGVDGQLLDAGKVPGGVHGGAQQKLSEAGAERLRRQAEIGKVDDAVFACSRERRSRGASRGASSVCSVTRGSASHSASSPSGRACMSSHA